MALKKIAVYEPWKALDPGAGYPIDLRYAAMPALTKQDIRNHFPQGMLPADLDIDHSLSGGEIELVYTSGTTDEKITNIWNQKWWDASERSSWKLNSHMQEIASNDHREAILANPLNVGFISDDLDLPMGKRRLARFLYLNEKSDPTTWSPELMNRMIDELAIFQPVVLEANPSLLSRLSRYIFNNKSSVFQPDVIIFTYEYVTELQYSQIRRVFRVPMISSYGTTEIGYVFMECEAGKFHQNTDFCRVDFEPFKTQYGGPLLGRIMVTPFDNPWCYFIRFDTGDLVSLEESGKCPCGRNSGIILGSINGRKANLTLTVEGKPITLFELDHAISRLDGIEQYRLIQNDYVTYELHLVSHIKDKDHLMDEAERILKNIYGAKAIINIVFDDDIPPEISGKSLISKALFPIDIHNYLERGYDFK